METVTVRVRLFGAFRKYGSDSGIELAVPRGVTVERIRPLLMERLREIAPGFPEAALVLESAFADEKEVLRNSYVIDKSCSLAVLPPVCGG